MRFALLLSALFLSFLMTTGSQAASRQLSDFSGADLARMCASTYDTDYGFCAGYVSAIANTLLTDTIGGFRACNHAAVKSQQAVDTFVLFAKNFPNELQGDANVAVAASLARAFPCL